jgi:3-oxoacyl-[acyl-carrier protein] reductase
MEQHGKNTMVKKYKRVLILGASSDIGIETCKKFLENEWVLTAHYNTNNKALKHLKKKYPLKLNLLKFDLKNIFSLEKYLDKKKTIFSKFDAFINLTGYFKSTTFENFKIKDLIDHISANSFANLLFMKIVLKGMKKKKWGRVVNTSSIGTKFGGGNKSFCYSLSKFNNEFFPSFYKSLYSSNIMINTLQIGVVKTKMHKKLPNKNMKKRINLIPIKRIIEKIEVSNYIYFLCTEENTSLTGQTLNISGGE